MVPEKDGEKLDAGRWENACGEGTRNESANEASWWGTCMRAWSQSIIECIGHPTEGSSIAITPNEWPSIIINYTKFGYIGKTRDGYRSVIRDGPVTFMRNGKTQFTEACCQKDDVR